MSKKCDQEHLTMTMFILSLIGATFLVIASIYTIAYVYTVLGRTDKINSRIYYCSHSYSFNNEKFIDCINIWY